MTRWTLSSIAMLLLLTGCQGPLNWLTTRVASVLPQDPPTVPAPTYAAEIPSVQTDDSLHADRAEQTPVPEPPQREVREEDWPVMIACGMG